jgi:hypothetical protein
VQKRGATAGTLIAEMCGTHFLNKVYFPDITLPQFPVGDILTPCYVKALMPKAAAALNGFSHSEFSSAL